MFGLVPARSLLIFASIPVLLALLSLWDARFSYTAFAANGVLFAIAGLDALFSMSRRITIERHAPDVMSLRRRNAVELKIRSTSRRRLKLEIVDDLFTGATSADLPIQNEIAARGTLSLKYHVEPRLRGAYQLGDHHLRYGSALGLWLRQIRIPSEHTVRVYPDLKQIQVFDLLARESREYALVRASKLKGGESEFSRLRDHVPDDEFRTVDWKATARRQKLTVREYQLESNQNLIFMLEAGRMMTGVDRGLSRFDHALNATLMLAHVAARGGDRVGVLGFDEAVRVYVAPFGGASATRRMIQATYDLHPRLVEPDYDGAFQYLSAKVRTRALVIIFTHVIDMSVAETLLVRLNALKKRHLPLVVMFRDSDVEALLEAHSEESFYTKAAAAELLRWRKSVVVEMQRAGALVLETDARELTGQLISRYLQIKARHLL